MQAASFEESIDLICSRDPRYHRDAYLFVREGLDHTQKMMGRANKDLAHHITGQELLGGLRSYALDQYGPMALMLLQEWGLQTCVDFGEIVFNMVENKLLAKTDTDSREDFKIGYDFVEAFRRPFLPAKQLLALEPEPKSTEV